MCYIVARIVCFANFPQTLVDDAKFSQTDYYAWNYSKSGRVLLILECISLEVLAWHALNRGGIPLPPHTIDILPYARDVNIDTKHNTVRRFMTAKYAMQETHLIALIQQPI